MPFIDCPECGREISSRAPTCPECGCPVAAPDPAQRALASTHRWQDALNLLARLGIGTFLIAVGATGSGEAGVIGGVIIAASAIPAWFQNRTDRLRSGDSRAIERRLEQRIGDLERQVQEQVEHFDQAQSERVTDLEERLDFAERLLTRPKT